MDTVMKWMSIFSIIFILGCTPKDDFKTDLREYTIDNIHTVVGVGKWKGDTFVITAYDGNVWTVDKSIITEESAITLDSFKRVTR
jgi:hypothetical protein